MLLIAGVPVEKAARFKLSLPRALVQNAEQIGLGHHPADMAAQYQHRHGADLVLAIRTAISL